MLRATQAARTLRPALAAARASTAAAPPSMGMGAASSVNVQSVGSARVVELNRAPALNALNADMISKLQPLYGAGGAFRTSPEVGMVLMRGAGNKAFCAGGDM